MKVKIGNKIYDAKDEPIMIILSKSDKTNLANMHPDLTKYCCFPDDYEGIEEFMEDPPKKD